MSKGPAKQYDVMVDGIVVFHALNFSQAKAAYIAVRAALQHYDLSPAVTMSFVPDFSEPDYIL